MSVVKVSKIKRSVNWGPVNKATGIISNSYENCNDKLVPGLTSSGNLNVGLNEEERKRLESELMLEPGSLIPNPDNKFWQNFSITIPTEGLTLNDANPRDRLTLAILKADPYVANSLEEVKYKSNVEWVITSETNEAKNSNIKRDVIAKAYAKYDKLTRVEVIDALFMYGKDPSDLDPEVARDRLGQEVDSNPSKFLTIVGDSLFKDKVFVMKLIKAGVIKKHGVGAGTDMPLYFQDIMLGNGLEQTIAFIKADENQAIFQGLKKSYTEIIKQ